MSGIGAELPPHLLAKRKRQQEEADKDALTTGSGAKPWESNDSSEKRRKVMGPAMPPASLDERPTESLTTSRVDSSDEDDDEDDGYGPALPRDIVHRTETGDDAGGTEQSTFHRPSSPAPLEKLRRDDWMTMPPKQDDLAARLDPSKQRARGFNTGKGAKGGKAVDDDNSIWHETPEQKQKRLQDEMMGISKKPSPGPQNAARGLQSSKTDDAASVRIRERIESTRGPSLMDKHTQIVGPEADDDPSKRAFDREKDMGSGMRVGHTKRKEMLRTAAGFSSKFAGGGYL